MIDASQYLPIKAPVITAFRMQHGDLGGRIEGEGENARITAAWSLIVTRMDRLMNLGFLEMHHKVYATSLLDLKRAFDASQGVRWCIVKGGEEANLSEGDAASCYKTICARLGWRKAKYLIKACETEAPTRALKDGEREDDKFIDMPAEEAMVLRGWFDRLAEIMDEEMKKRKEALTCQQQYV
jgi:hypothetical protein